MIRILTRLTALFAGAPLMLVTSAFQLSCARPAQAPSATTVLTGARLIDGTGRPPIEQATIVIGDGRVQAVGPSITVPIPAGAVRVDVAGKTITPGLISAHSHVALQRRDRVSAEYAARWLDETATLPDRDRLIAQLRIWADYGITTIYTLGESINRGFNTPAQVLEVVKVRDEQAGLAEQGTLDRARVYMAGPAMRGAGGPVEDAKTPEEVRQHATVYVKTPEEGRQNVIRNATLYKADFIKIDIDPALPLPPPVYTAMIDEARKRGLRTAAHIETLEEARGVVNAGINALAHSVRDRDVDAALIAQMRDRRVGQIPTLMQEEASFLYETTPAFFNDPFFLRHVDAFRKQMEGLKDPAFQKQISDDKVAQTSKPQLQQAMRNLKILSDAGVLIALGTDSGGQRHSGYWPGYFEHREMERMVQSGLTPMQVVVAATSGSARVMGLEGQLGTLESGKWADLVVLNANPLTDIRNLREIDAVWIAGRRLTRPATTN